MDRKKCCKRKSNEKDKLRSSKHKKIKSGHRKKLKNEKHSNNSDTSTNSDSSESSLEVYRQKHKSVKHISKHKRKKSKHDDLGRSASKKKKKHKKKKCETVKDNVSCEVLQKDVEISNTDIGPNLLQASKAMAPMTKEAWEKQQSIVRRVYDSETGRNRLVKGDGEILEEIVSRERHKEINKTATINDGEYFKAKMGL